MNLNSLSLRAPRSIYNYLIILTIVSFSLISSPQGFAWGERGHDLVTIVAARLAIHHGASPEFAELLRSKEHQLAHLSNIPDIHWRDADPLTKKLNRPTHFFDSEFLFVPSLPIDLSVPPKTIADLRARVLKNCKEQKNCPKGKTIDDKLDRIGTAPWRIAQLMTLMERALKQVKQLEEQGVQKKNQSQYNDLVNHALLYAGLVSHFVGDLSNPAHCSKNYDGQESGNKGIHSSFETQTVNAAPLLLKQSVLDFAMANKPRKHLQSLLGPKKPWSEPGADLSYLDTSFALITESWLDFRTMLDLDNKFAITANPKNAKSATRRLPEQVYGSFEALIVKRLATGSDVLSALWVKAWQEAGKPGFKPYKSYAYPLMPAFVKPDYLD